MPLFPLGKTAPRTRVLCVDDNPDIADTQALFLGLVGFDARPCYGGRAALAVADTFRPGVCVLDMCMPGMDGDALAGHLRNRAAGRSLVLISVTGMGADDGQNWTEVFDLHLRKPVDPERLLAAIHSLAPADRATGDGDPGPPAERPAPRGSDMVLASCPPPG